MGHAYMRAIEQWLWETGWGCKIPDVAEEEEGSPQQEEDIPAGNSGSDSDDPSESGGEEGKDGPSGLGEGESDEDEIFEDEETLEGEFGYSAF